MSKDELLLALCAKNLELEKKMHKIKENIEQILVAANHINVRLEQARGLYSEKTMMFTPEQEIYLNPCRSETNTIVEVCGQIFANF